MRVEVNEPRRDDQACGVHHAHGACGIQWSARDHRDTISDECDITREARRARAIHDRAVPDQDAPLALLRAE